MANTNNGWKKPLYLFLIVFTLFILDNTIVTMFSIKGVYPSLLFVFMISYSIINGYTDATIMGVIVGIFQDIYFPGVMGINMLVNMLLALIAAQVGKSIFKEKAIVPIFSTFLLSILKSLLVYVLLILLKNKNDFLYLVLYKGLYEMAISILTYKLILKFCQTKIMKKEWRF